MMNLCNKTSNIEASRCLLTILSDVRLGGVLPGLNLVDDGFNFVPKAFKCCEGTGIFNLGDLGLQECDVRRRLQALTTLVSSFRESMNEESPDSRSIAWLRPVLNPEPSFFRFMLRRLTELKSDKSQRGIMYGLPKNHTRNYSLRSVALAAVWRYGFDVRFCSISDQRSFLALKQMPKEKTGNSQAKSLLFVEGVGGLWDCMRVELFEAIISFAHASGFPLWISWDVQQEDSAAKTSSARTAKVSKAIANRIERIKARSPIDWIDEGFRQKLLQVSEKAMTKTVSRI